MWGGGDHKLITGYVLKADVKHYFETVDHKILLDIIKRKVKCYKTIWLISNILNNYKSEIKRKGMPLGNLTSQFFANTYLNELDQFVKHNLKARYYIRYVDDFAILHKYKRPLEKYKKKINDFLKDELLLELHPGKSKIIRLKQGINFLGQRIFYYHKLIRKTNLRKMQRKLDSYKREYDMTLIDYDKIFEFLQGWCAYAKHANTYKLRNNLSKKIELYFPRAVSTIEINRLLKNSKKEKKIN